MSNLATLGTATITPARANPFEPSSLPEAMTLAETLAKSALVPSALRGKPQDILLILATARELGIGPMQAISDVNVIQGKPVMSADLMLALCKRRPDVCRYIRLVESTPTQATYETQRVGAPEPERFTFTIEDAKRLGIAGKDNYQKQPATMLRRRAASQLARETYQDLVRGYDPDEAEDFAKPAQRKEPAVLPPRRATTWARRRRNSSPRWRRRRPRRRRRRPRRSRSTSSLCGPGCSPSSRATSPRQ
jgi:hypothetical protein